MNEKLLTRLNYAKSYLQEKGPPGPAELYNEIPWNIECLPLSVNDLDTIIAALICYDMLGKDK